MIIGFIAGAFDLIHPGYISMFKEARKECDLLVVGLHDDPSLERPDKIKPIFSYDERALILSSLKYVDKVYPYRTEKELANLINKIGPSVRFLGDDYKDKPITGDHLKIPIFYLDRSHGWSTTKLKKLIYEQIKIIS